MFKKIHITISGDVQGVFYRVNAKDKADGFGLAGWVKNTPDDKVEVLAEGEEKDLKELIKWCYNGSKGAKVDEVEIEWRDYKNKFDKFKILL